MLTEIWCIVFGLPKISLLLAGLTMKPTFIDFFRLRHRLALFVAVAAVGLLTTVPGCSKSTEPPFVRDSYLHIRPAWSPDGSTIAFTGLVGDTIGIYLVDTTGAKLRLLRLGEGIGVTWSPDSRWIAFSSNDSLIAMTATGDSMVNLTDGSGNIRPGWSPDGLRIAFIKKPNSLWLLNVASGVLIDLGRSMVDYPCWNPMTSELVYLEPDFYANTQGIVYEFKALDIAADTSRVLYSILTNYNVGFSSISPTGTQMLFSVAGEGSYVQLFAADLLL
ncbi:MAG: PD40 domain-containing protein, partial [Proteobacteria bacterium]|nr:PD40 domain-containing protein [Pseudomonadota bacterium]